MPEFPVREMTPDELPAASVLPRPTGQTGNPRNPDVKGMCPSCGSRSLFLGNGGHVTCSWIECKDPCAADKLLSIDPTVPKLNCSLCRGQHRTADCPHRGPSDAEVARAVAALPDVAADRFVET